MKSQMFHAQAIIAIFSEEAVLTHQKQNEEDEVVKEIILKAFHFRGRKKGAFVK